MNSHSKLLFLATACVAYGDRAHAWGLAYGYDAFAYNLSGDTCPNDSSNNQLIQSQGSCPVGTTGYLVTDGQTSGGRLCVQGEQAAAQLSNAVAECNRSNAAAAEERNRQADEAINTFNGIRNPAAPDGLPEGYEGCCPPMGVSAHDISGGGNSTSSAVFGSYPLDHEFGASNHGPTAVQTEAVGGDWGPPDGPATSHATDWESDAGYLADPFREVVVESGTGEWPFPHGPRA